MARKKKLDPESEAALSMVKAEQGQEGKTAQATKEQTISYVSEMVGSVKAMNFMRSLSDLTILMKLRDLKENKRYKDLGMTWEETCEAMGLSRRTVDDKLADLRPFRDDFLGNFAGFISTDFNKIKYLGEAVSGKSAEIKDNAIVYGDEVVPLTPKHRDRVQAVLDQIQEDLGKQVEEKDADLRAQKRIVRSKEDVIKKMERDLKRLEKKVDLEELTAEEIDSLNILEQVQTDFLQGLATIKKNIPYDAAPEIALRRLYFLYIFISKVCMEERLALHELYRDADEVPWEITDEELPPPGVLETETPLTAGLKKKDRRG